MNYSKQYAKLIKVMNLAAHCVDRKTGQKILKKAAKINAKLNK
tara:strand:- start:448 stop:576 length:129 start_codon:yes stop_codon:yes gene_type:complete